LDITNNAEIIFCTCIAAGRGVLKKIKFDIVIIDECTQAIEPSTIISILKLKDNGRLILVGDHKQLPPSCNVCDELEYSLFERLINEKNVVPFMLQVQYRMHSVLINFSSR